MANLEDGQQTTPVPLKSTKNGKVRLQGSPKLDNRRLGETLPNIPYKVAGAHIQPVVIQGYIT